MRAQRDPTPGRVLGYARVSSRDQDEHGTSLEGQQDEIRRACAARGFPAPDIRLEVESGAETAAARPVLRTLLGGLRRGEWLMVAKQDRLSRDTLEFLRITRELSERGVRFFSIGEQFDPETPAGRYAATIMAATAEHERDRIRERTVDRRHALLAEGYWCHGARPPFGYRRGAGAGKLDHLVLEPVAEDAAVVVELYRRCVRGSSVAELVTWLEDTREGRGWSGSLVKAMLASRVYLGEVKTPAGWVRGKHPAIVPLELWTRALAAKKSRDKGGRKPSPSSRTAAWLIRPSFARCAACEAPMRSAYGRHPEHTYLACRDSCGAPWVRVREVDAALEGMVLARLRGLRTELAAPPPRAPEPARTRDFAADRRRLEAALERAQRLAVDGDLDAAALRRERERVGVALERLELERAEVERAAAGASPGARRALLASARGLARAWGRAPVADRRRVLELLAERVTVAAGEPPIVAWKSAAALAVEGGSA